MEPPTKERLIEAAALLFRQKGYDGVGLAEILAAAKAPKGSLYHHFPNGKSDLALASAKWASNGMLRIIDEAFADAQTFDEGATTLCHKIAKFFDISGGWDGCPVSSILLDGSGDLAFRDALADYLETWVQHAAALGMARGLSADEAERRARLVMIGIQGAWVLCRAQSSADPLRQLPDLLGLRTTAARTP
ncbi:MAG: TetR/AcrR family transcriptional regulator [Pseudomonadota bacterium]